MISTNISGKDVPAMDSREIRHTLAFITPVLIQKERVFTAYTIQDKQQTSM